MIAHNYYAANDPVQTNYDTEAPVLQNVALKA